MAADQLTSGERPGGHQAMDYPSHVATYRFFTSLIKSAAIFTVFALLLLAFLTL